MSERSEVSLAGRREPRHLVEDRALGLARAARSAGHGLLLETDAFQLIESVGLACPRRLFAANADAVATLDLSFLATSRAVVKVVSPEIGHKTDVGGVAIVDNTPAAVRDAVATMSRALTGRAVTGFAIAECVTYDPSPGAEWLLGLRWTDEFGAVVTIGCGGVAAEFLAGALEPGRDVAVLLPSADRASIVAALERLVFTPLVTGGVRRQKARVSLNDLCDAVERMARLAPACRPDGLPELEINPLVPSNGAMVALDIFAKVGTREFRARRPRPLEKMRNLLTPRTVAIAGVSAHMNPGHVILNNLLREGFPADAIRIVKPGATEIEGCRAVPSIKDLAEPVDLLVLSIPAAQVPEAIIDTVSYRKAESVIVIPGGLEEKAGTADLLARMHAALGASRLTAWQGPIVNGGNCLGIQSRPGRYDTMFLPSYKLFAESEGRGAESEGPARRSLDEGGRSGAHLAIVSQSGAFAASRVTRLAGIKPRYCITVGNQMDLTIGDYLQHLQTDPEVKVVGVYVEGFKPLDGTASLEAIRRMTAAGVTVVIYRAGRTQAGAAATASHTASMAGDYTVTSQLARAAGAIVADTLDDFTDLVSLFTRLGSKKVTGRRIGALSNAGYECVALADSIGDLELASFTDHTDARLAALFDRSRLAAVVDVHNPLDLTPMMSDEGYEAGCRIVLDDEHVEAGVIGCVPATPALNTLPASPVHGEDLERPDSLPSRLIRLYRESRKPWIAIVDAGTIYDPLAHALQAGGIPTFRSADRALRLLGAFLAERLATDQPRSSSSSQRAMATSSS